MEETRPKLTPRQKRFIAEYLVDLNATNAAIRAGYSEKTAFVQGPRLLGNVRVASYIAEKTEKKISHKIRLTTILPEEKSIYFSGENTRLLLWSANV
jgi:phage terminase small subunit